MNARTTISITIVAALLLPTALALADGTRTFYLYPAGSAMSEDAPGPMALPSRYVERDGIAYLAVSPVLDGLRIPRADAFRLHLSDREPLAPVADTYVTRVWIFLIREDGVEPTVTVGGTPERYYLVDATRAFHHSGSAGVEARGWTDFAFSASPELPTAGHCAASGCIRYEGDVLVIPAGYALKLEVGLVPNAPCHANACAAYDAAFERAADEMMAALHAANGTSPVNIFDPLGLSNFDPVGTEVQKRLRDQDGHLLRAVSEALPLVRSSWATASSASDSRLEVRTV